MGMKRKAQCPFLICQSGLWCIVRPGCHSEIQEDVINGDLKVWRIDCMNCLSSYYFKSGKKVTFARNDLPGDSNLF